MGQFYAQLSAEDRGVIMAMKANHSSARKIAAMLERSPSTISRELKRNGYQQDEDRGPMGRPPIAGGYYAPHAGVRARRLRFQRRCTPKLLPESALWLLVSALVQRRWSPRQVSSTLKALFPDQADMHVSHETIYKALYAMPRGELRLRLVGCLRRHHIRRHVHCAQPGARRGNPLHEPSIHDRPLEARLALVPGHWEGDLIIGKNNQSQVATLVDRHTMFVVLIKLPSSSALDTLEGMTLNALPPLFVRTLIYDQGMEMTRHAELSAATGIRVYFADPHSPWQRGINENINGLLRQYMPKSTDLSVHSQADLDEIALDLNRRPRQSLGWKSPIEMLYGPEYRMKITPDNQVYYDH